MMNSILNLLLKMGLSVAATDRDLFVNKLADTIEQKMAKEPEQAQQIGEDILSALDGLNQYLETDQILRAKSSKASIDSESIKALTAAIQELNQTLKNK